MPKASIVELGGEVYFLTIEGLEKWDGMPEIPKHLCVDVTEPWGDAPPKELIAPPSPR